MEPTLSQSLSTNQGNSDDNLEFLVKGVNAWFQSLSTNQGHSDGYRIIDVYNGPFVGTSQSLRVVKERRGRAGKPSRRVRHGVGAFC